MPTSCVTASWPELVRNRKARRARYVAEQLLIGARINSVDNAVDFVRQRGAALAHCLIKTQTTGDAVDDCPLARDRYAQADEPVQQRRVRRRFGGASQLA